MGNKFGKCRLCPKLSPTKKLFADDLCAYHLQNQHDDQSQADDVVIVGGRGAGKTETLSKLFFEAQVARIPRHCENCDKKLGSHPPGGLKSYVCHIVPKKNFKSVMFVEANIWFGCLECHTNYDNNWKKATSMKIWPVVVERFKSFMDQITVAELRFLPPVLRQIIDDKPQPPQRCY